MGIMMEHEQRAPRTGETQTASQPFMRRALPVRMLLVLAALFAAVLMMTCGAGAVTVSAGSEVLTGGAWKSKTVNGTVRYRYKKSTGKYAKNGWKQIDGKWYCADASGYVYTGKTKINGKYYYFRKKGGAGKTGEMLTGLQTISKKKYFFRESGGVGITGSRVESEWVNINGIDYYFTKNGVMHPQTRLTEDEFVKKIGKLARADMQKTGILASVTIAQAILESGYGSTSLAMEANNYFGMKATLSGNTWTSEWDGSTFAKKTLEWYGGRFVTITAAFRAYKDIAASIRDHSNYLCYAKNGTALRYKGVVNNKSYKKTIQIIKNGGYATDPDYVTKICSIIKRFKLTKYDK